jgi:FKBP-type peptidyl-prolyl cis-trans isomerase FkpA
MKKMIFAAVCITIIIYVSGCYKTPADNNNQCTGPKAVTDSSYLLSFAKTYGITPVADTSWLYYQIIVPGSGSTPVATSKVYIKYAGRFMDGTYFDSTATTVRYELDSLIKGLQYGLLKIKTGGRIKLLVPSALAYGCQGAGGVVPPNAPLYFDMYLDSLK